jgi:hypothetical protein
LGQLGVGLGLGPGVGANLLCKFALENAPKIHKKVNENFFKIFP